MGRRVLGLLERFPSLSLGAIIEREDSELVGTTIAGTQVTSDLAAGLAGCEVYIDFTVPAATTRAVAAAAEAGVAAVIGTTGLSDSDRQVIDEASGKVPVLVAANFSLGVNLLCALAETASRALPDFDFEIVELHHNQKRDSPSGTALALARSLADGRGQVLDEVLCTERSGDVGPRPAGEIGVMAVRGGDIVGEHTAYLIGATERIELSHRASSRDLFAEGALRAASWLAGRPAGRYAMRDVLGL